MDDELPVRVLIIDDEPAMLTAISEYLMIVHGLKVDTIDNPREAISSGQIFNYDCLVLDYDMPEMDGITLLKAIRLSDTDIPIVILTGKSREDVAIEAINNGANYYLVKGGNPDELFAELAHIIGNVSRQFRAEHALQQSEQLYRAVVEEQTEYICQMSPKGKIRFVNTPFATFLSAEATSLIGTDFFSLFGEAGHTLKEALDICDPDNPVTHTEVRISQSNGQITFINWTLRLLFEPSFDLREILAVGRDVTVQREISRQVSIQRDLALQLAAVSSVGLVLEYSLDAAKRLSGLNTGAVYLRDRIEGVINLVHESGPHRRSLRQFIDLWQNDHVDILTVLSGTPRYYSETDLSENEGPFLSISLIPVQRYDEVIGWVALGSDIIREVPLGCRESVEIIVSQIGNVIARIDAEDALRDALIESEERYMQLSESSPDAIAIISNQKPVYLNPAALSLFHVSSFDEFITLPLNDYFEHDSYPRFMDMLGQSTGMHSPHSCEAVMKNREGDEIYGELVTVPITQTGERAVLLIIRDKTKQRLSERALAESELHFRELADLLPEPVFETDADGIVTFYNRGAAALLAAYRDVTDEKIQFIDFFREQDQEELKVVLNEVKSHPGIKSGGFTVRAHDGTERSVLLSISPIMKDTNYSGVRGVIVDVTEMKQYQERLQRTIDEKDILFRELHHRVKNNMQVISSLLHLQEEYIDDDRVISAIRDCEQRIESMALVHETLYRSDSISDLPFNIYLEHLIEELTSSIATISDFNTEIDVGDVRFGLDTVVTLGLIINELMVNSIKHAFVGMSRGTIQVRLKREEEYYIVHYSDDGIGLPDGFSIDTCNSLGMRLVRLLSHQLLGSVSIGEREEGPGAHFTIRFPGR